MQSNRCAGICSHRAMHTGRLSSASYAISKARCTKGCSFSVPPHRPSSRSLTPTGPGARTDDVRPHAFASSSVTPWCLGRRSDKQLFLGPALKLSTGAWRTQLPSVVGFDIFSANSMSCSSRPPWCTATTYRPSNCQRTQFTMGEPSMSN